MLSDNKGSVSAHSGLDLESLTIIEWISLPSNSCSVNGPALVCTIMASPPDDVSVVRVGFSVNIKALSWDVSDVSDRTSIEGSSLVRLTNPLSDDSSSVDLESLSSLVGDGIVSFVNWSNGSSSSVKEPPLSDVPWLMVLDSESKLISTNMFMPEESSSVSHS